MFVYVGFLWKARDFLHTPRLTVRSVRSAIGWAFGEAALWLEEGALAFAVHALAMWARCFSHQSFRSSIYWFTVTLKCHFSMLITVNLKKNAKLNCVWYLISTWLNPVIHIVLYFSCGKDFFKLQRWMSQYIRKKHTKKDKYIYYNEFIIILIVYTILPKEFTPLPLHAHELTSHP